MMGWGRWAHRTGVEEVDHIKLSLDIYHDDGDGVLKSKRKITCTFFLYPAGCSCPLVMIIQFGGILVALTWLCHCRALFVFGQQQCTGWHGS